MCSPNARVGILPCSIKLLVKVIKVGEATPRILKGRSLGKSEGGEMITTHHSGVRILLAVTSQQAFIRELEDGHLHAEVYQVDVDMYHQ